MKRGLIPSLSALLGLLVSGGLTGPATDPVPPEILERQRALEQRLERFAPPAAEETQRPAGAQGLAQWYNRWPNWRNWSNWRNW